MVSAPCHHGNLTCIIPACVSSPYVEDQATEAIVDFAAKYNKPFAVVRGTG
jgi:hypothetical protein